MFASNILTTYTIYNIYYKFEWAKQQQKTKTKQPL